jgi:hypothetical protein
VGALDSVESLPSSGEIVVKGWSADADAPQPSQPGSSHVHLYVDGQPQADVTTSGPRPDVEAAFPFAGPNAGFEAKLTVSPRVRQVCAYGINQGPEAANSLLGCRDVGQRSPVRGAVDTVSETAGTFVIYGWMWDPAGLTNTVIADADGQQLGYTQVPDHDRPDVAAAVPGAPVGTGFRLYLNRAVTGTVCVHGFDGYGNNSGELGCLPIPPASATGSPSGSLDEVRAEVGRVVVRGWAVDPDPDPPEPYPQPRQVHVYMDGQLLVALPLDAARPDVAAVIPGAGPADGYDAVLPARPGPHQICVYAINRGRTGRNATLGCSDVDVPASVGAPLPFGSVDGLFAGPPTGGTGFGQVGYRGWAAAPGGTAVRVRVVGVGGFLGNAEQAVDVTGATGVSRPDVPAAIPGTPEDSGYEILAVLGHFFDFRLACVIAQSVDTGAESVLGCDSYVRFDGNHF